jgi:hypothetical protein
MLALLDVNPVAISWLILVDPFEFPEDKMRNKMLASREFQQTLSKPADLESIVRDDQGLEHWLEAAKQYEQAGDINFGAQRLCLVRFFIKYEEGFQ